jgi:hypothetical protein
LAQNPAEPAGHALFGSFKHTAQLAWLAHSLKQAPVPASVRVSAIESSVSEGFRTNDGHPDVRSVAEKAIGLPA